MEHVLLDGQSWIYSRAVPQASQLHSVPDSTGNSSDTLVVFGCYQSYLRQ